MKPRQVRRKAPWSLPVLLFLSGCGGADPDCNSADTRTSVIKVVSEDISNPLVSYAVETSNVVQARLNDVTTNAEKSATLEAAKRSATYKMSDQISTNSKSKVKREVSCSGLLSATVEETTAQKKIDFEVEQMPDGTMSVWVSPFKFEVPKEPSQPKE